MCVYAEEIPCAAHTCFLLYQSSFGAKDYGPLENQEAFAPETTTSVSMMNIIQ